MDQINLQLSIVGKKQKFISQPKNIFFLHLKFQFHCKILSYILDWNRARQMVTGSFSIILQRNNVTASFEQRQHTSISHAICGLTFGSYYNRYFKFDIRYVIFNFQLFVTSEFESLLYFLFEVRCRYYTILQSTSAIEEFRYILYFYYRHLTSICVSKSLADQLLYTLLQTLDSRL